MTWLFLLRGCVKVRRYAPSRTSVIRSWRFQRPVRSFAPWFSNRIAVPQGHCFAREARTGFPHDPAHLVGVDLAERIRIPDKPEHSLFSTS